MSFFVSLLTGYKKYEIKKINNNKKLEKQNKKMVEMLKRNNISKINLTSIGNSIATGYSAIDTIKPLLKRNESLKKQLEKDGIDYNCYSFARPQNNNDEHLLNWLIKNIKLSGPTEYCMGLKETLESKLALEYANNDIEIEVI